MMDMYSLLMGGGSGGGLPSVSSSDLGAGLCVVKTPVEGDVIVPEQTATYDEEVARYDLSNTNPSLFTEGATVMLTIGDYSGVVTVYDDGILIAEEYYGQYGIYLEDGALYAWDAFADGEPITVKCSLVSYSYEWGIDPYVGYDVVIEANHYQLEGVSGATLKKGTYADMLNKMSSGKFTSFAVYGVKNSGTNSPYYVQYGVQWALMSSYVATGEPFDIEVYISEAVDQTIYTTTTSGGANTIKKQILAGNYADEGAVRRIVIHPDNSCAVY